VRVVSDYVVLCNKKKKLTKPQRRQGVSDFISGVRWFAGDPLVSSSVIRAKIPATSTTASLLELLQFVTIQKKHLFCSNSKHPQESLRYSVTRGDETEQG
jgi:hypothetical protein